MKSAPTVLDFDAYRFPRRILINTGPHQGSSWRRLTWDSEGPDVCRGPAALGHRHSTGRPARSGSPWPPATPGWLGARGPRAASPSPRTGRCLPASGFGTGWPSASCSLRPMSVESCTTRRSHPAGADLRGGLRRDVRCGPPGSLRLSAASGFTPVLSPTPDPPCSSGSFR